MKKYGKEILILAVQLFMFYIFPMFAGPTDAMGMVFLILLTTFLLGAVLGAVSDKQEKYCYPGVIALLFIPSVFIYYNSSALVHALWYLVVSAVGLLPTAFIRFLVEKRKER